MRILVTGKNGQVDTSLRILADMLDDVELTRIGLPEVDLARPDSLRDPVLKARPDVIISSAAYTSVDKAESEPEIAQAINGDGPGVLARLAADLEVPILHLSTDYVFSGEKSSPYVETDHPQPNTVYGATKLSGEAQIRALTPNHVILRTSWVYSPYGANFPKTMLRLAESRAEVSVVSDQFGCPTYAPEIARALLHIARRVRQDKDSSLRGIFHLTGLGETSWAGFAQAIFDGAKARGLRPVKVCHIASKDYPTAARRPANSRLDGSKLKKIYNLELDPWRKSLDQCLDALIEKSQGE